MPALHLVFVNLRTRTSWLRRPSQPRVCRVASPGGISISTGFERAPNCGGAVFLRALSIVRAGGRGSLATKMRYHRLSLGSNRLTSNVLTWGQMGPKPAKVTHSPSLRTKAAKPGLFPVSENLCKRVFAPRADQRLAKLINERHLSLCPTPPLLRLDLDMASERKDAVEIRGCCSVACCPSAPQAEAMSCFKIEEVLA